MYTHSTSRGLTAHKTAILVYHKMGQNATVLRRLVCGNGGDPTRRDADEGSSGLTGEPGKCELRRCGSSPSGGSRNHQKYRK